MSTDGPTQSEMWEQDLDDAVLGNTIVEETEDAEKEEDKEEVVEEEG